jgi:hypothetical protein
VRRTQRRRPRRRKLGCRVATAATWVAPTGTPAARALGCGGRTSCGRADTVCVRSPRGPGPRFLGGALRYLADSESPTHIVRAKRAKKNQKKHRRQTAELKTRTRGNPVVFPYLGRTSCEGFPGDHLRTNNQQATERQVLRSLQYYGAFFLTTTSSQAWHTMDDRSPHSQGGADEGGASRAMT